VQNGKSTGGSIEKMENDLELTKGRKTFDPGKRGGQIGPVVKKTEGEAPSLGRKASID